jgi:hypothetical protein
MRVGVDFLREEEYEEVKTLSKLSSLLTYSVRPAALFPRSGGRAVYWPSAYATVSPNRSWHYCSLLPFYRFPLLLCDWPTVARSPSGPLIVVKTLSSAHVAL